MFPRILLAVYIFMALVSGVSAQNIGFNFLPNTLNFFPLKGNHKEARLGVLYFPKTGYLKVDIGNTVDLLEYRTESSGRFSLGIDFMGYAFATNYQGRRLQIDALDGFFGGNISYSNKVPSGRILGRFRIIHNSSHFVDGHFNPKTNTWKGNQAPIPFTQDFAELTVGRETAFFNGILKYYSSFSQAFLNRPSTLKRFGANGGFEYSTDQFTGEVLNKPTSLFFTSHLRLFGTPAYQLSYVNMLGIKFGEWYGEGILFYLSFSHGNNQFNEYYLDRITLFGIGFFVEFI